MTFQEIKSGITLSITSFISIKLTGPCFQMQVKPEYEIPSCSSPRLNYLHASHVTTPELQWMQRPPKPVKKVAVIIYVPDILVCFYEITLCGWLLMCLIWLPLCNPLNLIILHRAPYTWVWFYLQYSSQCRQYDCCWVTHTHTHPTKTTLDIISLCVCRAGSVVAT